MKRILINYGGTMILYIMFILLIVAMCSNFLAPSIPQGQNVASGIAK